MCTWKRGGVVLAVMVAAVPAWGQWLEVHSSLLEKYMSARAENAAEAAQETRDETAAGVPRPGIFLHPATSGDARVIYDAVSLPAASALEGRRPFLLFYIGIRDGVPWNDPERSPNGVEFAVHIDGERVFERVLAQSTWRAHAVDLSPWAGPSARAVKLELRTNAIDGNTHYDWAVFGDPLVVSAPRTAARDRPMPGAGAAILEVDAVKPAIIVLATEDGQARREVPAGKHWVATTFEAEGLNGYHVERGPATVEGVYEGVFPPELRVEQVQTSTPLLRAGRPFNLVVTLRNEGRGRSLPIDVAAFLGVPEDAAPGAFNAPIELQGLPQPAAWIPFDAILPGSEATGAWEDITLPAGDYTFTVLEPESVSNPEEVGFVHHSFRVHPGAP